VSCVGIVLVSHSAELAEGLKKLLQQVQPQVPIAAAGGSNDGEIGTSAEKIQAAVESVRSEKGVVVFFDLGSALINAEMALEGLDNPGDVLIADAPLVEGSYVAVVESGCGSPLEVVLQKARKAKNMKKI
jgi:phosphoenolpyruvate---glycerone phosphotransferase subunit DhaM